VQDGDDGPHDSEQPQAELQADDIEHVASQRLQHDAGLEKYRDPGIFQLVDAEIGLQRRRGITKQIAGEIVEKSADGDQADHPPAQAPQPADQWQTDSPCVAGTLTRRYRGCAIAI
jgi:hypothetical protein